MRLDLRWVAGLCAVPLLVPALTSADASPAEASVTATVSATATATAATSTPDYEPTYESLAQHTAPEWFNDDKFGIFIHWGPTSVPARDEWYQYRLENDGGAIQAFHRDTYGEGHDYDDFFNEFTAENFDPDAWVDTIQDAGAKYFVLTTKHHDGYALFPSQYSDRTSAAQAPGRDLLGELFDAAEQNAPELKKGAYYSNWEWLNPAETGSSPTNPFTGADIPYTGYKPVESYPEFMNLQMEELIDNYDPDLIWCDGDWLHGAEYWDMMPTLAHYYNQAKNRTTPKDVVVNNRCKISDAGTGFGHTDRFQPDYLTPEQVVLDDIQPFKWETSATMGSWFNLDLPLDVPTATELVHQMVDVVSKNGNYLLNVSPTVDGLIPEHQQALLGEIGDWMRINGEAIYGTTYHTDFQDTSANVPVRFTKKDDTLYVTAYAWPGDELDLSAVPTTADTEITLLGGDGSPLEWSQQDGRTRVEMPAGGAASTASTHAYTFKVSDTGIPSVNLHLEGPDEVLRGETASVEVTVTNTGDEPTEPGTLTLSAPAGLIVEPSALVLDSLNAGASRAYTATLRIAPDAPYGVHPLTVTADVGGKVLSNSIDITLAGTNAALDKPATQSSTYAVAGATLAASVAVDGDIAGSWNKLSHTQLDQGAWWQVDLEREEAIYEVRVWNRVDGFTDRLSNYRVIVSADPLPERPLTEAEMAADGVWTSELQTAAAGRPTAIPADADGRYVRVQLAGQDYLALSEFEVMVEGETVQPNLALNKPTDQSSTYVYGVPFEAARAVDGDNESGYTTTSHTELEQGAWWQVDLEQDQSIDEVRIWNRTDGFTERLSNYRLIVSDTPFPDRPLTADELAADGVWSSLQTAPAARPTAIPVGADGRYVRVQLAGANYLALAEVEVHGTAIAPEPEVKVSSVVETRCIGSKAFVTVKSSNDESGPVSLAVTSEYGTKAFASVAAGKNAVHGFATRAVSVPAGEVTVEATRISDGEVTAKTVAYDARACG